MKKAFSFIIALLFLLSTTFPTQSFAEPTIEPTHQQQQKLAAPHAESSPDPPPLNGEEPENQFEPTPHTITQQNTSKLQEPDIEAKSYLLMDAKTGIILTEKAKDQPLPPASMTKMMTAYIVLDQIKQQRVDWEDEVVVSKRAEEIDEAQIHLIANERISIKELFTGLIVQSANDAAVALAEHIAGSEENFVNMMNQKANEMGLTHTHFNNVTGLDKKDYRNPPQTEGEHVMSAYDLAKLAKRLIQDHPNIFDFTTIQRYTFHPGTKREQTVENGNKMLPGLKHEYQGVDGIKTGFTKAAGYCFTGTVKQKQIRYISVVMGTSSTDQRFIETKKLYDYGYQQIQLTTLYRQGQALPQAETITIQDAKQKHVPVVLKENIRLPIVTKEKHQYTFHVHWKQNLTAPIPKGTVVGTVELRKNGKKIEGLRPFHLITKENVEKANAFEQFLHQTFGYE